MIIRLMKYFKKYKFAAIACPSLVIVEVFCDVLMPFLMAKIVNRVEIASVRVLTSTDINYIIGMGLMMVLLALLGLFCGAYSTRLGAIASQGAGAEIRGDIYEKVQKFSFSNLDKFSVPSLITRLTTDVNNLQQTGMMGLRMFVRAPFMMILALILALSINTELAFVFIAAIPILGIAIFLIMTKAHPRFIALQNQVDELNSSVQENLTNIRIVKSFVRYDYEKDKFKKTNDSTTSKAIYAVKLVVLNMPMMQLVVYACIIAILWFGGNMVLDTGVSEITTGNTVAGMHTGDLISFVSYVTQIMMSLMMLSMVFLVGVRARASAVRIIEVLDSGVDLKDPENPIMKVDNGDIEFKDVSFRYSTGSGEDTLSNVNLFIKQGETIGIIGATGSAKTTFVQLIPRLYDVANGEVLVGGHNVREYSLNALRDSVAMVLQKNTLFSGTIRKNMQWGNKNATDEQIIKALEQARAWDFVSEMPDGLNSEVSQGGTNFSGGQKQRLCIARALLKSPKIIIMDDSTSAVDTATDAKIRESFANELKGITSLIIAQRISSIMSADRIIVLDDGRINAIGTHAELINSNEIYKDVYTSQQEGAIEG